jgi:hypothetical protein
MTTILSYQATFVLYHNDQDLVSIVVSFLGVHGRSAGLTSMIKPLVATFRYIPASSDPSLESERMNSHLNRIFTR